MAKESRKSVAKAATFIGTSAHVEYPATSATIWDLVEVILYERCPRFNALSFKRNLRKQQQRFSTNHSFAIGFRSLPV
jgi:hypothetical protein